MPRPPRAEPPTGRARRRPLQRARKIGDRLAVTYPGTASELCALEHHDPFELLVATILSAQCTDERVNIVMPVLFRRYPTPRAMAAADRAELESLIRSTGFFRSKASHILGASEAIVMRHGGEVPRSMEELTALAGVGRKTANVVLSVAFGLPGLPVDTHVTRLSRRLGLTAASDPVQIEKDVCGLFPPGEWGVISLRLILHGRKVCDARRPRCESCEIADLCPSRGSF
ncbi:MAG: endonuclease III [Acidimicrobiales bacterium]